MFSLYSKQVWGSKVLTGKTVSVKDLSNLSNSNLQTLFSMEIFFPNGLHPRWIREINPMGLGDVPSCIRFPPSGYLLVQLFSCVALRSHFLQSPKFMLPRLSFGLLSNFNQLRITLPHLSSLPAIDICLFWTLHILPPGSKSRAFCLHTFIALLSLIV